MTNYYELLGIANDAGKAEIEQAIKKTRRLWNNRSNSPDATIRAEAEKHVREIAEAEKILLNDSSRQTYDADLAKKPAGDAANTQDNSSTDWENDYWQAYNRNMNEYAAQIAQSAINRNSKDGRAWFLYGEALRHGGDIQKGAEAMERATLYLSTDEEVFRQLGIAYTDLEKYKSAYKAFQSAISINPKEGEYYARCAVIYLLCEKNADAIKDARKGFEIAPDDDYVRYIYFESLYEGAMSAISYNRSSGKHLIINKVQLDYANAALTEMARTMPNGENKKDCSKEMDELTHIIVDAESKKGGGFLVPAQIGYIYNNKISNEDTRSTGLH